MFFISLDIDRKAGLPFGDGDREEGGRSPISFQRPSDLPFHLLLIPDLALFGSFGVEAAWRTIQPG